MRRLLSKESNCPLRRKKKKSLFFLPLSPGSKVHPYSFNFSRITQTQTSPNERLIRNTDDCSLFESKHSPLIESSYFCTQLYIPIYLILIQSLNSVKEEIVLHEDILLWLLWYRRWDLNNKFSSMSWKISLLSLNLSWFILFIITMHFYFMFTKSATNLHALFFFPMFCFPFSLSVLFIIFLW